MKILCCNPAWSQAVLHGHCSYDYQAEALSSHQLYCRYDTRLTEEGKAQAVLARVDAKALSPKPEVLITSPLTRALHTAQLAFGTPWAAPRLLSPHAASASGFHQMLAGNQTSFSKTSPQLIWTVWRMSGGTTMAAVTCNTSWQRLLVRLIAPCLLRLSYINTQFAMGEPRAMVF